MGLYLKCDYGYISDDDNNSTTLPVNNLVVTDRNRTFFIPTEPTIGSFPLEARTPEQFADIMQQFIGEQYGQLTLFDKTVNNNPDTRYGVKNYGHIWFPSAWNAAPNLTNAYAPVMYNPSGCIVFNNGDLIVKSGEYNQSAVYVRDGDNYRIFSSGGAIGAIWQVADIPILTSPIPEDGDFSNAIFGYIECFTNTTGKRDSFSVESDTGTTNLWKYVLGVVDTFDPEEESPYDPAGNSEPGGGGGSFSDVSDPIDIPDLPTLSAVNTGFVSVFNPTVSNLRDLADFLWSPAFSIDTFKKIFQNPMDAILGLGIVPVSIPDGGTREIVVGNVSTGVEMKAASTQYVSVDCGELTVNEFWGAYLDYSPYTKCFISLPYCGTKQISTDDVMGKTLRVVYHVDILSGSCVAFLKCGDSVLYQYNGNVLSQIPITSLNFSNVVSALIGAVASATIVGATGGITAGVTAGIGSVAQEVANSKINVGRAGSISNMCGLLAIQYPYLIIERPRQCIPNLQRILQGYPSFITKKLGTIKGFTKVQYIHLEGCPCTEPELTELLELLENGVIL